MSESDIVNLCEQYIGRSFDEKDLSSLRLFLKNLQNPKASPVKTPVVKSAALPKTVSVLFLSIVVLIY
jgi:hypothetical protein